jgi:hypothetical protein
LIILGENPLSSDQGELAQVEIMLITSNFYKDEKQKRGESS